MFAYEMRNALAHGYFQVDLEIVWKTVRRDLPKMERQVRSLDAGSSPTAIPGNPSRRVLPLSP